MAVVQTPLVQLDCSSYLALLQRGMFVAVAPLQRQTVVALFQIETVSAAVRPGRPVFALVTALGQMGTVSVAVWSGRTVVALVIALGQKGAAADGYIYSLGLVRSIAVDEVVDRGGQERAGASCVQDVTWSEAQRWWFDLSWFHRVLASTEYIYLSSVCEYLTLSLPIF